LQPTMRQQTVSQPKMWQRAERQPTAISGNHASTLVGRSAIVGGPLRRNVVRSALQWKIRGYSTNGGSIWRFVMRGIR
jgi:hypothetical protein